MDIAFFWIQIATLVLMAVGIIATLYISTKEMKNSNAKALEQSRNSFFAEYTRRYHDILLAMPVDVFLGTAPASGETLKYMQLYFDLCSEEYHLYLKKQIPDDIWKNWKEGMRLTTKVRLYKDSWTKLAALYNQEFALFITHEIFSMEE